MRIVGLLMWERVTSCVSIECILVGRGLSPVLRQSQSCHVHRAFRFVSVMIVMPPLSRPPRGELAFVQNHNFDPPILLAPGLSLIGCNRVCLAVPASRDPLWADVVSHQEVSHSRSTLLGQV